MSLWLLMLFGASSVLAAFDTNTEFRSRKINMVWEKVRHRLPTEKAKSLYLALVPLDQAFMNVKHSTTDGKNYAGSETQVKEVDAKLQRILSNYQVQDVLDALEKRKDFDHDVRDVKQGNDDHVTDSSELFKDRKLFKLWQDALRSGFTEEELVNLQEEFTHYQQKLDDYMNAFESTDTNDIHTDSDRWKNSPQHFDLKSRNRELNEKFQNLKEKIATRDKIPLLFKQSRVQALWDMAVNSGFNESELDALRIELQHFESKLTKLEFLRSNLADAKADVKKRGKDFKNNPEHREKVEHLEKYEEKLSKLEKHFQTRVSAISGREGEL